ncbi:hypothetical protein [Herbaspirillum seropedicae]|uniref:hypothetical protein n=1 Tax=Herbaspirillum seropedicae TaxID=964 RepID=UPI003D96858C
MPLSRRLQRIAFGLLILWLIVSAFYYIQDLFSPTFYMGYDEGRIHKALKYFICASFSVYFCIAARAYGLLLFCGVMLLFATFFTIDHGSLEIASVSLLVTSTMLPFILVPTLWRDRMQVISRVIVICGAIVGVFSIVEIAFLGPLFEAFWKSTGSIRSVSTLFNPNNLGLYVGVALLLLPYMRLKKLWNVICGLLLFFPLAASGSRTAWVGLFVVFACQLMTASNTRRRIFEFLRRNLSPLLLTGIVLIAAYQFYLSYISQFDIVVANRGTDLYTASVRLSNLNSFVARIDDSLLFPDTQSLRAEFIQDNFYLIILNSFGLTGLLVFSSFFAIYFSTRHTPAAELRPWKFAFLFYMVSGLSVSQLNSFPNNLLFFLSMGALWTCRTSFGHKNTSTPDAKSHNG